EEGPVTGPVALTPIQHWFLEGADPAPHHYNQTVLLDCQKPLQAGLLARALTALVSHHDALRLRLRRAPQGAWEQFCAEPGELVDLPVYPLTALEEKAGEVQAGLHLTYGPLLKAALFQGESRQRLLIAIHHMAVDGVSWRILLEDLQTVYTQLEAGQAPALPPRTASFQRWAEALGAWQPEGRAYWLDPRRAEAAAVPMDGEAGENTWASARTVTVTLSAAETRALLSEVPAVYRTRIDDVLLTALARTISAWTGRPQVAVNLEGHGREPIAPGLDLSRTVGWFTALYPVLLDLAGAGMDDGKALKLVKEQLRAVPGKGLGYGVLRYLQRDADVAKMPEAGVSFNYLGQFDQAAAGFLTLAPAEEAGPTRSPRLARRHLLEVDAMVAGDQLQMTWTYSANRHQEQTVQELAETLAANLRVLIAHCLTTGVGGCTPSDFPLAALTQTELDVAIAEAGARPCEVEEVLPLTPLQQTMLRESLASPDPGTYLVQMALDLAGPLDPVSMEEAWQRVVQRHAILRTSFAWRAAPTPVQVVRRHVPVALAHVAGGDLEAYLAADRQGGFALDRAPLLRLAIVHDSLDRHTLVFSIHHLLLDGWSNGVILSEVVAAYEALVKGSAPALAPVRPFREYLQWLAGRDRAEAEAYWQRTLDGAERTPLPGEGARVASDGHAAFPEVEAQVPAALVAGLQQVGRRQQITQHTLVQGAWALLLSAFSGRVDVLFGTTAAGRPADLSGVESMVGPFINTLPVRVKVAPDQTALAFLQGLQLQSAELRTHEHAPVPAAPEGNLFDSVVVYENYPLSAMAGSLKLLGVCDREQTHYGLTLMAIPSDGGLLLKLVYDRNRFDHGFVERIMAHLLLLLRNLTGDLTAPLSRLLVTPSDQAAD
ncbi:MAG TPA: condensation domain-containing protein, partial [Symbiobacteriaceae bacterium]|nr:condensation domain-containing protein [Symbiobacteriaceae bacterium]